MREVVGSLDHWLITRHDFGLPSEAEQDSSIYRESSNSPRRLDSDAGRNRLRALLKEADLKAATPDPQRHGTTNEAV